MSPAPQSQHIGTYNSQNRREGPQRIFVYGTLKKGYGNHSHYLKECKELGQARIEGLMFHLGGFPAINLTERFSSILGEVYEVTWDNILSLDQLEGVGHNFYDRIEAKVEPHGIVWTYIFPSDRARKEQWVVPSGIWSGPDTTKVKWAGFGKGVEVGVFATRSAEDEIKIGAGESDYILRRSPLDSTYKLINKKTREVIGSYKHLRDMVGTDGNTKPVLRLPAVSRESTVDASTIGTAVRSQLPVPYATGLAPIHQHPNMPIIWTPPEHKGGARTETKTEEESIPQAARLLGLKYGEA